MPYEITLNLPEQFAFRARGFDLAIAPAELSPEVLAQAIEHGLKQTVADAASAAASGRYETTRADDAPDWKQLPAPDKSKWSLANADAIAEYGRVLMEKRLDALRAGEWNTRAQGAPGMTRLEEYMAEIVAARMEFAKGVRKPEKLQAGAAKLAEQTPEVQAKVQKLAEARIAREDEEKKLGLDLEF